MRGRRAFTLMEILLAMAIAVPMILGIFLVMSQGMDLWEIQVSRSELQTTGQRAMMAMVRELQNATRTAAASPPNAVIPAQPNNTRVRFYLPSDIDTNGFIVTDAGVTEWGAVPVDYVFDQAGRQLQRTQGATTTIMSPYVAAVTFEDITMRPALAVNQIRISLLLQKTTSHQRVITETMVGQVKLRN